MADVERLPSGAFRIRANKTINGKTVRKSFSVHPKECGGSEKLAKKKCRHMADEWILAKEESIIKGQTVKEAVESYIDSRSKVLSPSTLLGYRQILKALSPIHDVYITDIDTPTLQGLINEWCESTKRKTMKNRLSFLMSVLDYCKIDKKFKLNYGQNDSKEVQSPDVQDVKMLIDNAPDTLRSIIYLAAFGTLRRGEIAGLKQKDISRDMNTVSVNGDIVYTGEKWVYKLPKTEGSVRTVQLPKFIIDSLPKSDDPDDFVFNLSPNAITDRFRRLSYKLGFNYSLHSLRHFAASFRSDIGIPRKYIEEAGGWESDSKILQSVYDNKLNSSRRKYTQITNNFIEENFNKKKPDDEDKNFKKNKPAGGA